jgi:uncharacterized membrane protein YesL
MKIFSYDSKFSQLLLKLCYACYLNLLWLVCSLPIVTVGASTTALYYSCLKIVRDEDSHVGACFFRSFRENFRQATALWLILLLCGGAAVFDAWLFLRLPGALRFLSLVFALLFLLVLLTASMLFPLLSQFRNGNRNSLKNALALSLGYLPRSFLLAAMGVFPFFLLWRNLYLFLSVGFLWVALYFSAAAYLGARILKKVFAPYREVEP